MQKKGVGAEEIPSDKRRRIGGEKLVGLGRGRAPFGALNNKSEVNEVSGAGGGSSDGSEGSVVDFTEEEVDALLEERMKKGIPRDTKVFS